MTNTPTDTLARLRATLDAWRDRSAEVKVQVRSTVPQGTTTVNADADCAAAFALIDAMIRAAPALLDVVESALRLTLADGLQQICGQPVAKQALRRLQDALARLGEAA